MPLHHVALFVRETWERLLQYHVRYADLSYVMEFSGNLQVVPEAVPFLFGNIVVERPAVINLKAKLETLSTWG